MIDLTPYSTLHLDATAEHLVKIRSLQQLQNVVKSAQWPLLVLGEGSNTVFKQSYWPGTVLLIGLKGIEKIEQTPDHVVWRVAAGESWHRLVLSSLKAGLSGLENLALIPGTVGAAPIQNIGAYGVELADRIESLYAVHEVTGELKRFSREACQFGYRHSLFKAEAGKGWIIVSVDIKLSTTFEAVLEYGPLQTLQAEGSSLTAQAVADHVIAIRRSKLPDPNSLSNAGSFFQNPVVSAEHYARLKRAYPELVAYPTAQNDQYKLAAGWMIEQVGLKGCRQGLLGVHRHQALVLVNYADWRKGERVKGEELIAFAKRITSQVKEAFDVELHIEPRVV